MKIHTTLIALLVLVLPVWCAAAADPQESFTSAGALYSQSVDLAHEGKYQEALDAADRALAMNVSSLTALIQSNRAGILVMLHRNDEAIVAADAALAVEGNLTTARSVAWYNKGNALRALGRNTEAQDAYSKAYALDNSLVPPDMSAEVPLPSTPASPLPAGLVPAAIGILLVPGVLLRKK
jgi:tetratricopeptide (TPR) repeat protein